ncbi:MAG TPA: PQQ-dependent sugar dehydrogenase [Candidatus Methylomirabilis sp.]|nr:PQQ-dependent sugar dehydrogenase [Candidatus Methylomirabilis sp.]
MKKTSKIILVTAIIAAALLIFLAWRVDLHLLFPPTPPSALEKVVNVAPTAAPSPTASGTAVSEPSIKVVAENLNIPWEMAFLPGGDFLLTERPGNLIRLNVNSVAAPQKIVIADAHQLGEGGLLGLALHPNFVSNHWLYLYLTVADSAGKFGNEVVRYVYDENANTLSDKKIILTGIVAGANHDGGRIAFGPDGLLYITTGEAGQSNLAQNKKSLNGKILRIKDDGSIPADNPFGNAVYSFGNRNSEGIAWDAQGRLWATEHGPSGLLTGFDEINLIVKGGNYGWPTVYGAANKPGLIAPIIQSGATDTWAPTGDLIIGDTLLWTGLRGEAIYSAKINGDRLENFKVNFKNQFGRLRFIKQAPDGWLYIATNNTDGRGTPRAGDDKLIRLNAKLLIQ